MRWNDIVLLLVRAKSREHYVIPAHYLGKCPNSAQTKHTTGVRAYLGPWQWNTCSLVLYVVSHVVSGVHKILGAIVWWERGGWVVGQVDVAR